MTERTTALLALCCTLWALPRSLAADIVSVPAGTEVFPAAPQRELVVRACAVCHPPELVVAKRHTVDEWDEIIAKMVDRGAVVNDEEQQQILTYLAQFFGPT